MALLPYVDIVRKIRKEKNIRYSQLALVSGVDESRLSRAERGVTNPPKEKYLRPIAQLLEIDPDLFVISARQCPEAWIAKLAKNKNLRKSVQHLMSFKAEEILKVREYIETLKTQQI